MPPSNYQLRNPPASTISNIEELQVSRCIGLSCDFMGTKQEPGELLKSWIWFDTIWGLFGESAPPVALSDSNREDPFNDTACSN